MRRQGKDQLAVVFAQLAAAEREHVDSVTRWSRSGRAKDPDPALVRWEAPETIDVETAAEVKSSHLMTPYHALAMAVRNEERAFAFWSYLAAYSEDPEIKQASESMAKEELGHVATLRKERRRAYHREHDRKEGSQPELTASPVDARRLELRLAAQLTDLERRLSEPAAVHTRELSTRRCGWPTKPATSAAFRRRANGATRKPSPRRWQTRISRARGALGRRGAPREVARTRGEGDLATGLAPFALLRLRRPIDELQFRGGGRDGSRRRSSGPAG